MNANPSVCTHVCDTSDPFENSGGIDHASFDFDPVVLAPCEPMVDWITARVSISAAHALETGGIACWDADGQVEWQITRRMAVRGSYEHTIAIRKVNDSEIEFSGSPAKFLRGHNIFGSGDLIDVGARMILRACELSGIGLNDAERSRVQRGQYRLLRVDINQSFEAGSRTDAEAWIVNAASHGRLGRRGPGRRAGGSTVMWGQGSKHWLIKAYGKGAELEADGHQLASDIPNRKGLLEWADGKIRIELQLRGRELKKLGLDWASLWSASTSAAVFRSYSSRLEFGPCCIPTERDTLPMKLRPTYLLWKLDQDLRRCMSRWTMRRHRKDLLQYGIDIDLPPTRGEQVNDIPLAELMDSPALLPAWNGNGLAPLPTNDSVAVCYDSPVLLAPTPSVTGIVEAVA
jgi:hypothetical protein